MSVRDFLNRGIRVSDVTVASGDVPQAAPALATDGTSLPLTDGGISILPPMLLVYCDLDGGVTPTATLQFWAYSDPPAAAPALLSDWQLLSQVVVSDTLGQSAALFPLVGVQRYQVIVTAITGAPTSICLRHIAVSHHAADILISLGIVASSPDINLSEVGGTAIPSAGLAGVLPVGGTEADAAVPGTSFSSRIAGIVRGVLTALTDTHKNTLLLDLFGRLWTHPDPGWEPYDGASQRLDINAVGDRSAVLTVGAEYHITATVACWIVCGGAAVAAVAGADYRLLPDVVFPYTVTTGKDYIAVIRETTDAASGLSICRVR